jgi:hypothetical protein
MLTPGRDSEDAKTEIGLCLALQQYGHTHPSRLASRPSSTSNVSLTK